jgi:hypothetical protein
MKSMGWIKPVPMTPNLRTHEEFILLVFGNLHRWVMGQTSEECMDR